MLAAAVMMCTAGKLLNETLDVMQLTYYTAPVSMAVLFPFFLTREVVPLTFSQMILCNAQNREGCCRPWAL